MKDTSEFTQAQAAWQLNVRHGTDWLIVHLQPPQDDRSAPANLAADIQELLRQHFATGVVLEMDDVAWLSPELIDQLVQLHKQIHADGGMMRLSGVNRDNNRALRDAGLEDRFPRYIRRDADPIASANPKKPR